MTRSIQNKKGGVIFLNLTTFLFLLSLFVIKEYLMCIISKEYNKKDQY